MPGIPVWNEIPQMHWRPNNPPLDGDLPVPVPIPQPQIPTYESIGGDLFFRTQVGVPLEADSVLAGQTLNNGSSVWFSRACYDILAAKFNNPSADITLIMRKHRNDWRALMPTPEGGWKPF
jgi:hypothetical protein